MQGGDTDTNACIVGGLVGAAVGVQGIPKNMAEKVLGFKKGKGVPRPDWLYPGSKILKAIEDIYNIAPESLSIID